MKKLLLTKEQNLYFIKIVKNHSTKQIQELLYKKYKVSLTAKQIQYYKSKNHLKSGIKRGGNQHNIKPIGSEYIRKDGYTYIKINENPKKWVAKHKYIYEKYYGKIPDNNIIIFLDQNKNNFDISNLKMIKRKELMNICNNKLLFKNKELTESGILLQKLINKNKKLEKNERL